MNKYLRIILLVFFFSSSFCSTKHIALRLDDFSDSTELIGKNIIYTFEQVQNEEALIISKRLIEKDEINPSDFKTKVFTEKRINGRKELIENIVNYIRLLQSVFEKDYRKAITKNIDIFNEDIDSIRINHKGFITKREQGILISLSQGLTEAISYSMRRGKVLKIMGNMQKVLEKTIKILKEEVLTAKILIDNYYKIRFIDEVARNWRKNKNKRLRYAKIGMKIQKKRMKIETIFKDLINALDYIPKTHKEIIISLKNNKNFIFALKDLINFAYRINASYKEFSKLE